MQENKVKNLVFASSVIVYGMPEKMPVDEKTTTDFNKMSNPYGRTKFMAEFILKDLHRADNVIRFYYFVDFKLNVKVSFQAMLMFSFFTIFFTIWI